jgi:hypothetical protein
MCRRKSKVYVKVGLWLEALAVEGGRSFYVVRGSVTELLMKLFTSGRRHVLYTAAADHESSLSIRNPHPQARRSPG